MIMTQTSNTKFASLIPMLCIFCGWEPDDWNEYLERDPYVIEATVTNDEHVTRALRVVELKRKKRELERELDKVNRELRELGGNE